MCILHILMPLSCSLLTEGMEATGDGDGDGDVLSGVSLRLLTIDTDGMLDSSRIACTIRSPLIIAHSLSP